jgi:NAD(P)H-hydrate epimerase
MSSANVTFNLHLWNRHALLTAAEMRRAEEMMCARDVVSADLMMERAGRATALVICERYKPCRVLVLCGPGNNGGDGFITAEDLRAQGWKVTVATMRAPHELSGDAAEAAKKWRGHTVPLEGVSFAEADLVVDALFGTGLTRAIDGLAYDVLARLGAAKIPVVSIDLPSGVNADNGEILGMAPHAALTVTFFRKKIGHLLLPGATLCGEIIVADIGIESDVLNKIGPRAAENHPDLWMPFFPVPKPEDHKYTRGHALIYGGAVMTGAARLAARAAQRMGVGLVTVAAPSSAVPIYASTLESAIVRPADYLGAWEELLDDEKRNAILIGPGLGLGPASAELVLEALKTEKSCVLDADALTNFSDRPERLMEMLHPKCILTPHEGEFSRLFGTLIRAGNKLFRTRAAAELAGCTVLLKGADTVIASQEGFAVINAGAPPWLAVAGAGDVLAGMILGLVAQKMPIFTAVCAAVSLHGRAAATFGPGLIAEDLIETLPTLLRSLPLAGKRV